MTFGQQLKSHRLAHHLSAEELAIRCGTSRSYITLIENGKRLPGRKVLPKIAAALELPASEVIGWYLAEMKSKLEREN